jgi:methyl-accepting chemotaxis protein
VSRRSQEEAGSLPGTHSACHAPLVVGLVSLAQLSNLGQRTQEVQAGALVPSSQLATVRRAFLQTRVDALADELLPKSCAEDVEHQAYVKDVDATELQTVVSRFRY